MNKIEDTDKIANLVEFIINFNEQNKEGHVLKILTPNQMLSRLPIFLVQLRAGNNAEKLKNEMMQILYSCRQKFTKQIYESLIDIN